MFELTCLAKSTFLAMKNSLRLLLKFLSAVVDVSNAGPVSFEGITSDFAAIFPFSLLNLRTLGISTKHLYFFFSTLSPYNSISWAFFFFTHDDIPCFSGCSCIVDIVIPVNRSQLLFSYFVTTSMRNHPIVSVYMILITKKILFLQKQAKTDCFVLNLW